MYKLMPTLREADTEVIQTAARFWGVDVSRISNNDEQRKALYAAMIQPGNGEAVWEKLDDNQRGALQMILGSKEHRVPLHLFTSIHGEIRRMGRAQVEREDPLNKPKTVAEGLYYRGLIYQITTTGHGGTTYSQFILVPNELVEALPAHQTSYSNLEALPLADDLPPEYEDDIPPIDADLLEEVVTANTTVVDDVATMLGYFQVHSGEVEDGTLADADQDRLLDLMIDDDPRRLIFMFEVSLSAKLLEIESNEILLRRVETKRWLESARAAQLHQLVQAWRETRDYRELWHIDGLYPEKAMDDPSLARTTLIRFIKDVAPLHDWWSIDDLITQIKAEDPDFQRPGSDYHSWYIRNASDEYLQGFESWDAIEGSILEFILNYPMHWLGLIDLAEDAARLNAYGRAFVTVEGWPTPDDPTDTINVSLDGDLTASRRVPRMDRFQAMRFTTWGHPARGDEPFTYKLTPLGIQQAAAQGITTEHISAFLTRMMGVDHLPAPLVQMLNSQSNTPQSRATLETLLVLRTTAPETLDYIMDTPELRRYCGARLGDMAVSVRKNQWEALRDALAEKGIQLENLSS